jgi:hypothetical protein
LTFDQKRVVARCEKRHRSQVRAQWLRGDDVALPYAITAVSLAALSIAAIAISLWMLSRESMLLSEQGTAWSNFLGLFRSPRGSK